TTNAMDVFVLRKTPANGPNLTPGSSRGGATRAGRGKIEAVNAPLGWLTWGLEDKLHKPVIDETGLANRYDISLKWDEEAENGPSNGPGAITPDPEKLVQA